MCQETGLFCLVFWTSADLEMAVSIYPNSLYVLDTTHGSLACSYTCHYGMKSLKPGTKSLCRCPRCMNLIFRIEHSPPCTAFSFSFFLWKEDIYMGTSKYNYSGHEDCGIGKKMNMRIPVLILLNYNFSNTPWKDSSISWIYCNFSSRSLRTNIVYSKLDIYPAKTGQIMDLSHRREHKH